MTQNDGSQDAVVIERSFDAPMDLIWEMWTDPDHFKAWYGPDGATIPGAKMDVRVGGTRLVCMEMQSPAGPMQMWFTGEYREVVENERLVYTRVGFVDNVVVICWALRSAIHSAGSEAVERHWPGTPQELAVLYRVARLDAAPAEADLDARRRAS